MLEINRAPVPTAVVALQFKLIFLTASQMGFALAFEEMEVAALSRQRVLVTPLLVTHQWSHQAFLHFVLQLQPFLRGSLR